MMGGYFRRLTGTVDIQYGRRSPEGHEGNSKTHGHNNGYPLGRPDIRILGVGGLGVRLVQTIPTIQREPGKAMIQKRFA